VLTTRTFSPANSSWRRCGHANQRYACFLLHGITGSGKTEVYVHLMHAVLRRGGQCCCWCRRSTHAAAGALFPQPLPGGESGQPAQRLSEGERLHNWQQAQAGAAQIVLGTRWRVRRAARLALVIVDEEHDSSFKQQTGCAIRRATWRSSAPASAACHRAGFGDAVAGELPQRAERRYRMLRLTGRALAEARLPAVRCINITRP